MVKEIYTQWQVFNKQKPIWLRNSEEVFKEEYFVFYKFFSSDWEDYLVLKYFLVEG